ncbi:antibiotic biosynthesis monooxygenase [Enterococcus sp. HY326]|uniref:antibiotic biosynthesis monooxygenase n=1 Tax=Enterococcus sp. HY326 TaxID=2971265 RepID=UPI0022409279|nr:antibiotic biosynthesis monooxygenase [Enterococcus sp. HY326]
MKDQVLYVIDFAVAAEKEAAMSQLIEALVASTAKETGVLNYHWARNANVYTSLEHFESSQAAYDHLINFAKNFAEDYLSLGQVLSTKVYGNPDAAVKEILDGFGAVYEETVASYAKVLN